MAAQDDQFNACGCNAFARRLCVAHALLMRATVPMAWFTRDAVYQLTYGVLEYIRTNNGAAFRRVLTRLPRQRDTACIELWTLQHWLIAKYNLTA